MCVSGGGGGGRGLEKGGERLQVCSENTPNAEVTAKRTSLRYCDTRRLE